MSAAGQRASGAGGFSLLELLFCMVIAVVLFSLASVAISRLLDASAVDAGAQLVNDCLSEGRQLAVTQNMTVEVRLYAAPAQSGYGLMQLHGRSADGTTPALTPLVTLPSTATMDATAPHSSLIAGTVTPAADASDSHLDANTRCFHFLPDGTTDLASTSTWMVTVRALSQSDPAHFPANWACVELNPLTGRTQIYRP